MRILNIDRAVKDPRDRTSFAVMERAIQTVKKLIAVRKAKGESWPRALPKVLKAYNSDPLSTTGTAPEDVQENPVAQFWIKQQMAENLEHNKTVRDKKEAALDDAGGYREPTQASKGWFQRGFKPRMSEPKALVEGPDRFAFGRAHAEDATEIPSKLAQPSRMAPQRIDAEEADPLRVAFRAAAQLLLGELRREGPMPLVDAARILRRLPGFHDALKRSRKGLSNVLKLFPDLFVLDRGVLHLPGQPRPPVVRMKVIRQKLPATSDPYQEPDLDELGDEELAGLLQVAAGPRPTQPPEPPEPPERSPEMPPPPVPLRLSRTQPEALRPAANPRGFLGRDAPLTEPASSFQEAPTDDEGEEPEDRTFWEQVARRQLQTTGVARDVREHAGTLRRMFRGNRILADRWSDEYTRRWQEVYETARREGRTAEQGRREAQETAAEVTGRFMGAAASSRLSPAEVELVVAALRSTRDGPRMSFDGLGRRLPQLRDAHGSALGERLRLLSTEDARFAVDRTGKNLFLSLREEPPSQAVADLFADYLRRHDHLASVYDFERALGPALRELDARAGATRIAQDLARAYPDRFRIAGEAKRRFMYLLERA